MIRTRFLLSALGFLLLVTAGASMYVYHNLPEILRLQAQRYLQQYGVEDIEFDGLRVTHNGASIDTLLLRGIAGNITYQVKLASGEALYHWRNAFSGQLDSLALSSLEISITQTGINAGQSTDVLNMETLLPQRLIARLPARTMKVAHWTLHYQSPGKEPIAAEGSLTIDEQLELQLSSTLAGREIKAQLLSDLRAENLDVKINLHKSRPDSAIFATLSTHLTRAESGDWEWHLMGRAGHSEMLAWLRELDAERELALNLPQAADLEIQGDSEFSVHIRHPKELTLAAGADSDNALLRQLDLSYKLDTVLHRLDYRGMVDNLSGSLDLSGTLSKGVAETTLQPFKLLADLNAQQLPLSDERRKWIGWDAAVPAFVEANSPVVLALDNTGTWSLETQNASISLGGKESRIGAQNLTLAVALATVGEVQAETQLSASLSARLHRQILPQLEITLTQRGGMEQNNFSVRLTDIAESIRSDLVAQVNLTSGSGNYELDMTVSDLPYLASTTTPLLKHFKLLDDAVAIDSGTIHLETTLQSKTFHSADWEQQSKLTLENITGGFNEYRFEGLALTADWSGITRWKTRQPLQLSIAALNIGFAMKEVRLQASLPTATPIAAPQVRLDALSIGLFGGKLILPKAQAWDFGAPANHLTVQAKHWQLSELVALQHSADIEARGTLEGELPLTVADGRIIIENGYLRALPPGGSIRYRANAESQALAKSSPELTLALDLLSDFQYQVLSSEVQLDKGGNLLLGLSLQGSNPAQYQGQPINFNINVEQNLDPLLQSLRLSDNLVERIEGGLK